MEQFEVQHSQRFLLFLPQQCNVPGECQFGQLLGASTQPTNMDCLAECQATSGCSFYTHYGAADLCSLYETCPVISEEGCPTCVSGEFCDQILSPVTRSVLKCCDQLS